MLEELTDATKINRLLIKNKPSYSAFTGYFSSYFPVELLYGFNIHPVRMIGHVTKHAKKRELLNYMCAYLSDLMGSFEEGHFSWADNIIIPATCDSLYGAKEYIEKRFGNVRTKMFRLPLKFTSDYYAVYKHAVEEVMEWLSVRYSFEDELLYKAVDMQNQINNKIVQALQYKGSFMPGAVYLKLMIAKSVLPPTAFLGFLEEISKEAIDQNYSQDRPNILVLGPICDNLDLINYISKNHNIISNLMMSTTGLHNSNISLEGDVIDNLIRHYFEKAGTATSIDSPPRFIREISGEIMKYSIRGIIYLNYKFCEPHMFFSRQLNCHLDNSDVKMLYLELEHSCGIDAIVQNQIDAFMENI